MDYDVADKDSRLWAALCHASALFGSFLLALIIWVIKKDEDPYVDYHGREAINFQISIFLYGIVCFMLCLVFIGFLLLPLLVLFHFIFVVVATIRAYDGVAYRYPLCIRLL